MGTSCWVTDDLNKIMLLVQFSSGIRCLCEYFRTDTNKCVNLARKQQNNYFIGSKCPEYNRTDRLRDCGGYSHTSLLWHSLRPEAVAGSYHGVHGEVVVLSLQLHGVLVTPADLCVTL